jgi:uncharacterized protein YrrD
LKGHTIHAQDGDVGKVKDLYFDDLTWEMQYVVADTGGWLKDRRVLIPRPVLGTPDWSKREFPVRMTRETVEHCPPMSTHEPVSRQQEAELHRYLDIEAYWMRLPGGSHPVAVPPPEPEKSDTASGDPNLRSCDEIIGYHIEASDGEIGHVEDFVVDDGSWRIKYLVVDTRNWLPGRKVLVGVNWITSVDWGNTRVKVDMPREQIKDSPEYTPAETVTDDYIEKLKEHYGGMARWTQ